jgi:hypothetical protein
MNIYINVIVIITVIVIGFIVGKNKSVLKKSTVTKQNIITAPKSYKIVSFVLIFCHILTTVLIILFSNNSTEDIDFTLMFVMFPTFIGIILLSLWFNMKQIEIKNSTMVYRNMFGVSQEYQLSSLTMRISRERIKIFHHDKIICSINFLWENIQTLIYILPSKIPMK